MMGLAALRSSSEATGQWTIMNQSQESKQSDKWVLPDGMQDRSTNQERQSAGVYFAK
jgi:hypothetical protein